MLSLAGRWTPQWAQQTMVSSGLATGGGASARVLFLLARLQTRTISPRIRRNLNNVAPQSMTIAAKGPQRHLTDLYVGLHFPSSGRGSPRSRRSKQEDNRDQTMIRVLMVCMGNICRSPLAAAVTRKLAADAGLSGQIEVASAGTHGYHTGEAPDDRAIKVGASRGYDLKGQRARKVLPADFAHFDHILAMDKDNLAALERECPEPFRSKLRLFLDYADDVDTREVPDPYYGNQAGFERVADLCEAAARGFIRGTFGASPFAESTPLQPSAPVEGGPWLRRLLRWVY